MSAVPFSDIHQKNTPFGDQENPEKNEEVLRHLLTIEGQALTLVDDAQAEADRRVAEAEKQGRSGYEERYGREAAALDAEYAGKSAAIREEYHRQIESYRVSLETVKPDIEGFCSLLDRFLGRDT
jgi:cell division septum initiation protein DivIVA